MLMACSLPGNVDAIICASDDVIDITVCRFSAEAAYWISAAETHSSVQEFIPQTGQRPCGR